MINSNDRMRPLWRRVLGTGVRLCCLLALCLALSLPLKAYYAPKIVGARYGGFSAIDNESAIELSEVTTNVSNWKGGEFMISSPRVLGSNEEAFYATGNASLENGDRYELGKVDGDSGYRMSLPAEAIGKTVTFTVERADFFGVINIPTSIKVSWAETLKAEVTAYQLVSVKGEADTWVTYRADESGNLCDAYKVAVDEDNEGQYAITSIDSNFVPNYGDATKYEFTEKALLLGSAPPDDVDEVLGYRYDEGDFIDDGVEYSSKYIQTDYDGRFATIVDFTNLDETTYVLQMEYKTSLTAADTDASSELESSVGYATLALTVPTPALGKAYVEVSYGSDDDADATKTFIYGGYDLENARYQNMREVVEVDPPNADSGLNALMDKCSDSSEDSGNSGGLFAYMLDGVVIAVKDGKYEGSLSTPSAFSAAKTVELVENDENVSYFDRWTDGTVESVSVTTDAPDGASVVKVENASLYYDDKGDLINTFDVYVQLDATNANHVKHGGGDDEGDELLHGGANDYFLVSVVNMGGTEETIATTADGKSAEGVYAATALSSGETFSFERNYGQWYEGQLEAVQENPLYKSLEVRVSYLYPFNTDNATESSSRSGMMRTAADLTGDVIKSTATVYSFADADGVVTSVEGVGDAAEASVKAGVGHVTVVGEDVVIHNAQGMLVATGEGRHELDAGVYVVRVGGGIHKVVVR